MALQFRSWSCSAFFPGAGAIRVYPCAWISVFLRGDFVTMVSLISSLPLSPALMEAFPYPAISPHFSKMTCTNDSNDARKETPVPFIETQGHNSGFLLVSISSTSRLWSLLMLFMTVSNHLVLDSKLVFLLSQHTLFYNSGSIVGLIYQ